MKRTLKTGLLIFLTSFVLLFLFWSGRGYSIDGAVMYQFAKRLAFSGSFIFDPPLPWGGFLMTTSKWAPGLSFFYVPLLWIFSLFPGETGNLFVQLPEMDPLTIRQALLFDLGYRWISIIHLIVVSFSAFSLYLLAKEIKLNEATAVITALIYGLFSPMAVYAKMDYAQPFAGLLLIWMMYFFIQSIHSSKTRYILISGFFAALACITRTEFFILLGLAISLFFIFRWVWNGREKILPWLVWIIPILVAFGLMLWVNQLRFGSITGWGYQPGSEFNLIPGAFLHAFLALLIHPKRGLLVYFPITFLSFFGFIRYLKKERLQAIFIGAITFLPLIFYAGWRDWHAGYTWGPRFLIPFLPFWILFSAIIFQKWITQKNKIKLLILLITMLLGSLSTFQGLMFDRSNQAKSLFQIFQEGNFFSSLPYIQRMSDFQNLALYDSFWVRQVLSGMGFRALFFALLIFLSGCFCTYWILYLNKNLKNQ